MKQQKGLLYIAFLSFLCSCGGNNTPSYTTAKGEEKTSKDRLLNTGADLLQQKSPLAAFTSYLDGFHFYNGNIHAQMEAHHYVSQLNNDVYQAVIFDGNGKDAKLMGVEYIITARLFKTLPLEERRLWHSHVYEVKSGELIAPGIPTKAEHELMEKLVATYGKTIHTWHTDQGRQLPTGSPMLMMGFTKDGQLDKQLISERDKRFKTNTLQKKRDRQRIPTPAIISEANAWEKGSIRQFVVSADADSAVHKHTGTTRAPEKK